MPIRAQGPIKSVSVRDAQFQVRKVLASDELPEFTRLWENKEGVKTSLEKTGGVHFKLDISRPNTGGRWLYQTTGYVQYLDPLAQPVYKLKDPGTFNRLIGAEK